MIALFSDQHALHAPVFEFFRGERVPCSPAWFAALEQACLRITQYRAQALVVSLGLDTFADYPICTFTLRAADFQRLGERLAALVLPAVFVLEGGYATEALGVNAVQVLDGFEQGC